MDKSTLIIDDQEGVVKFFLIPSNEISEEFNIILNRVNNKFLNSIDCSPQDAVDLQKIMCLLYSVWGTWEHYQEDQNFKSLSFGLWECYEVKLGLVNPQTILERIVHIGFVG